MEGLFDLAIDNLGSPLILSFVLGAAASLARSDLSFPEAAAKALSIYLLFAIGFKGGVAIAPYGLDVNLFSALIAGVLLSAVVPFLAFGLLSVMTRLDRTNAAAVAAHYGSISIVTFVAAHLRPRKRRASSADGFMVAVAAAMEAPAILSALWLIGRGGGEQRMDADALARDPAQRVHRPADRRPSSSA